VGGAKPPHGAEDNICTSSDSARAVTAGPLGTSQGNQEKKVSFHPLPLRPELSFEPLLYTPPVSYLLRGWFPHGQISLPIVNDVNVAPCRSPSHSARHSRLTLRDGNVRIPESPVLCPNPIPI
jgi:hypothetical protein